MKSQRELDTLRSEIMLDEYFSLKADLEALSKKLE